MIWDYIILMMSQYCMLLYVIKLRWWIVRMKMQYVDIWKKGIRSSLN